MSSDTWNAGVAPGFQVNDGTPGYVTEAISRWERIRSYVLAATVALLAFTLVSSVIWEPRSIASGENLGVQERANVMLTTHVANDLFSAEELSWIEHMLAVQP
ncbi:hypothetical protein BH23CHL5_BH23CHL5_04790 [soil metagenome]